MAAVTSAEPSLAERDQLSGTTRTSFDAVAAQLHGIHRLGVAFSGGVDSAVLLAVAAEVLGSSQVVALLGTSASLASHERHIAHRVAGAIGVELVELEPGETQVPAYRANGLDRCYFCKKALFETIDGGVADRHHLDAIAYGENADDAVAPDRPGGRAATDHGVLRPLAAAGLRKPAVRALARSLGLEVADKPAAPCLASRIPHGQEVTETKLRQIEDAESVMRSVGFSDCRVRHHGEIARIEVPVAEIGRFSDDQLRQTVLRGVRDAGFSHVTIDLAGMQSGLFSITLLRESIHAPAEADTEQKTTPGREPIHG